MRDDSNAVSDLEWQRFERVFDWAFALANKRLREEKSVRPMMLFMKVRTGDVLQAGAINAFDARTMSEKIREFCDTLVCTDEVDVAVYIGERKDESDDSVNIRMVSKAFEVSVVNPVHHSRNKLMERQLSRDLLIRRPSNKLTY